VSHDASLFPAGLRLPESLLCTILVHVVVPTLLVGRAPHFRPLFLRHTTPRLGPLQIVPCG
jgi:hypothetical protein